MDCIFCKIIAGEIPAQIVRETEHYIAFRDINPVAPSHVLVVPKKHLEKLGELTNMDESALRELFELVQDIAQAERIEETGFRTLVNVGKDAGQEVKHLHFHIIGGRRLGRIG
ncbi:histidine triad nucleotide-binding protein [Kosmotoga pacifica]|uniref:HIT-like protein n=1 Tax=Kosmotoga pacifica TaxID=1330330 RepID=A0A0G2ZD68_9BACT|nr:histidine triad nucleotide-binding protein [Kosmotoga pacifica]AKI96758.1 HIT-like protein [Kosmotoga pacifica]